MEHSKQAQDVLVPAIDEDSEVSIGGLAEEASLSSMSFFFGPALPGFAHENSRLHLLGSRDRDHLDWYTHFRSGIILGPFTLVTTLDDNSVFYVNKWNHIQFL